MAIEVERYYRGVPRRERHSLVNPRWVQIVQGVANGMTEKDMSESFHIDGKTIQKHKASIATTMGGIDTHDGLSQAVVYGIRSGIVTVNNFPTTDTSFSTHQETLLQEVVEGKENKEIAARRGVTDHTIEKSLSLIYQKLGALNRYNAIAIATQRRINHEKSNIEQLLLEHEDTLFAYSLWIKGTNSQRIKRQLEGRGILIDTMDVLIDQVEQIPDFDEIFKAYQKKVGKRKRMKQQTIFTANNNS